MSPAMVQPTDSEDKTAVLSPVDPAAETESATGRELRKMLVVQKAAQLYSGVTDICGVTRGLAKTANSVADGFANVILRSRPGQKVDETLAKVAAKMNSCCESQKPEGDETTPKETNENPEDAKGKDDKSEGRSVAGFFSLLALTMVHLTFRFFPAFMVMRWSVHAAFLASQALLALSYDLADRGRRKTTKKPKVEAEKTEETGAQAAENADGTDDPNAATPDKQRHQSDSQAETNPPQDEATGAEQRSQPNREAKSTSSTLIDSWLEYAKECVYSIFFLLDVFIFIPYLNYQTYFLKWLDELLYSLAGIGESEADRKDRMQVDRLFKKTISQPRKLSRRKWIVDAVLDQGLGHMMRFPGLGLLLCAFRVRRPATPFQDMASCIKEESKKSIDLASYLRDDPNYDETKDPDYVPSDYSTDDSLEYKDDDELDLEPMTPVEDLGEKPGNKAPETRTEAAPIQPKEVVQEKQAEGRLGVGGPTDVTDITGSHDACVLDKIETILENTKSSKLGDLKDLPVEMNTNLPTGECSADPVSPFMAIPPEHLDTVVRLRVPVTNLDEPIAVQGADNREDKDEGPVGLFVGFSGVCGPVIVQELVPGDHDVDPAVFNVDQVSYVKDGKEFATAEEAGFDWDQEDHKGKPGKTPLKLGWLQEYMTHAEECGDLDEDFDQVPLAEEVEEGNERRLSRSPEAAAAAVHHSSDVDTGEIAVTDTLQCSP